MAKSTITEVRVKCEECGQLWELWSNERGVGEHHCERLPKPLSVAADQWWRVGGHTIEVERVEGDICWFRCARICASTSYLLHDDRCFYLGMKVLG